MSWLAAVNPAPGQPGGVWFLVFVGVVTAVGGGAGLAALLLVASQRRKNRSEGGKADADGAQAISNAAIGLLKPLEDQVARAEAETRALRAQLTRADNRLSAQADQLTIAGDLVRRLTFLTTGASALVDPNATLLDVRAVLAEHTEPVTRKD